MQNTSNLRLSRFLTPPLAVYISLVLGLFFTCADNALGRLGILPIPATMSAFLFTAPLIAIAMTKEFLQKSPGRLLLSLVYKNGFAIGSFLILSCISLIYSGHPTAYWDERGKWIFLMAYGFGVFLIGIVLPIINNIRIHLKTYSFIALLALLASIMTDVFNPGFFSTEVARAAGFPGNSNLSSIVAVILVAASLTFKIEKHFWYDLSVFFCGGFAILMNQSRSGLVEFLLVLIFYLYISFVKHGTSPKKILRFIGGVVFFVALVSISLPFIFSSSSMFQQSRTRFDHVLSSKQIDDGSSESRLMAMREAINKINEAPIVGHGTGYSRNLTELPHNMYLYQWVNNGILGLLSYILLLATGWYIFWKRKYYSGQALIMTVTIGGFFSHNILDQRPFLFLYGMLLSVSWIEYAEKTQSATRTASNN